MEETASSKSRRRTAAAAHPSSLRMTDPCRFVKEASPVVAALLSELGGAFETNGNIEEAERMYTTAVAPARVTKHPALHRVQPHSVCLKAPKNRPCETDALQPVRPVAHVCVHTGAARRPRVHGPCRALVHARAEAGVRQSDLTHPFIAHCAAAAAAADTSHASVVFVSAWKS